MSRKWWIILGVVCVSVVVAGGASALGYYYWRLQVHEGWYHEGRELYEEGEYRVAYNTLGKWLHQHPDDIESLRIYADAASNVVDNRLDHLKKTAIALNQILEYDPGNAEIQERLCRLYRRMDMWGELEYFCRNALRRGPGNEMLQFYLGVAYFRQNRIDEATAIFSMLCGYDPDNRYSNGGESVGIEGVEFQDSGTTYYESYLLLARMYQEQGLRTRADELLELGASQHPESASMHLQRARFYDQLRETAMADEAFERAFSLASENPEILVAHGQYATRRKDYKTAEQMLKRAIELEPSMGEAYASLAHVYERTDRVPEAIEMLEDVDPLVRADFPQIMLALGEMHLAQGNIEAMRETVDEYMAAYPTHRPIDEYFQARDALVGGRPDEAVEILEVVNQSIPEFSPAHFFLSVAYREAGMRSRAQATLDQYLGTYPNDQQARYIMMRDFESENMSLSDAHLSAANLLDDPYADPEMVVTAANRLYGLALNEGQLDSEFETVADLLRHAIELEPENPLGYTRLADLHISLGGFTQAESALNDARSAGIPEAELVFARARLALAQGDVDEASRLCRADTARDEVDVERLGQWASLLATRERSGIVLQAVDNVQDRFSGEDRVRVDCLRVELMARIGELEQADQLLREVVESHTEGWGDEALESLNSARLEVAQRYLQTEDETVETRAWELLDKVAEADPEIPQVLILQAEKQLRAEPADEERARQLLERALELDSGNVNALMGASMIAERQGSISQALGFARQAARVVPGAITTQRRVAELSLRDNNYQEAINRARLVLEQAPEDRSAATILFYALLGAGNEGEAEALYESLRDAHSQSAEWQGTLANMESRLLDSQGQEGAALANRRENYEENPDSLQAAADYAGSLQAGGNTGEAISVLSAFTEQHPDNGRGWLELARLRIASGDRAELQRASTALTQARLAARDESGIMPDITKAMIELQSRLGKYSEARALCDRYLRDNPRDAWVWYQKASLLVQMDDSREEALAAINQAIGIEDETQYRHLRGQLHKTLGNHAQAIQDLQRVADGAGTASARLDLDLAEAYLGDGQLDMAQRFYDSANRKHEDGQSVDSSRLERLETQLADRSG